MCFIIPGLLVLLGVRSLWEARALSAVGNDYGGLYLRIAGAIEAILGVVFLGVLIARGCSAYGGFNIMMGYGFTLFAVFFFFWRRGRRSRVVIGESRRESIAELLLVVGGIALVISGLTT
jgi:hypothetical protein